MEQISDVLAFLGGFLITTYATHQAIIALSGKSRDWMEAIAGLGGAMYLLGAYLAGSRVLNDNYQIAYALQSLGVGMMLAPRIVMITYSSLANQRDA